MSAQASCKAPQLFDDTATVGEYFSLLKPRVMSLVIFTAICGLFIAPLNIHPLIGFIAILSIAVGAGGSGCLNMWYERHLDGKMKRTQGRPIPMGRIHEEEALTFGMMLCSLSVLVMLVAVNALAASLLAFTIFYYAVIYTMWLKPRTAQNIVIGGAAGAFPPMIAWAAVTGSFSWGALSLFMIIFMWTPAHFWALALLASEDYREAGIPMLPNTQGEKRTKKQILLYTLLTILCSYAPIFFSLGSAFYLATVSAFNGLFLIFSIRLLNTDIIVDKKPALQMFAYSIVYLFALFLVLTLDCVINR